MPNIDSSASPTSSERATVTFPKGTAASYQLTSCRTCHQLAHIDQHYCKRCHDSLHLRYPHSIQRALALVITAFILYIPANVYPIMTTTLFAESEPSTIISGVILFIQHESYFVAAIIFTASVLIPLAKMIVILWLCYSTSSHSRLQEVELTRLYRMTELVGKWSMIDIFVVAILVALVHVTGIMIVEPGIATRAFALVVILTMFAALQFDVRLIWDRQKLK